MVRHHNLVSERCSLTQGRPQEIGQATRYIDLGVCLDMAGLPEHAARLYRMALRAEPDNALARRALLASEQKAVSK